MRNFSCYTVPASWQALLYCAYELSCVAILCLPTIQQFYVNHFKKIVHETCPFRQCVGNMERKWSTFPKCTLMREKKQPSLSFFHKIAIDGNAQLPILSLGCWLAFNLPETIPILLLLSGLLSPQPLNWTTSLGQQLYSVKVLRCRKHASGGPIRSRGGWDYALTISCFQMSVSRPDLLGSLPCASTTEPDFAVDFISPNSWDMKNKW